MSETNNLAGSLETPADAGTGASGVVAYWLDALAVSSKTEERWRKRAEDTVKHYRDDGCVESADWARGWYGLTQFNILYSNTETIAPAIYNTTPVPDVRRRFRDDDPVGKVAAQMLERCLIYTLDQDDFDQSMRIAVKDVLLPGRCVTRIRYEPEIEGEGDKAQVVGEKVTISPVAWERFRRGPARFWSELPWIAFEHFLTREEMVKLNKTIGAKVELDCVAGDRPDDGRGQAKPDADTLKRGQVWEIWDKDNKKVVFIAPAWPDAPLVVLDDPLGLEGFWPIPRPIYALPTPGNLVPVEPYRLYRSLARELERITERISGLVSAMKWRGVYNDAVAGDLMEKLKGLDDGELAPAQAPADLDFAKAVFLMPVEILAAVLQRLYEAREQVKQTIYEVTGISDIVRGASTASETATAQQIKAQWGSLRVQSLQHEVQRYARDLLRLIAEVIAEKFQPQTLVQMSDMTNLPTQQQVQQMQAQAQATGQQFQPPPATLEQVIELLRNQTMRCYRVDIETDSTIRADLTRDQQNIAQFVQGFGGFIQAVGPAVQAGYMQAQEAGVMLKSFSRVFKLGREVEDVLDQLGTRAPPPQQGDGGAAAAEQAKLQAEMQIKQAEMQMQGQLEQQKLAAQQQLEQQKLQGEYDKEILRQEAETRREAMRIQAEDVRHQQSLAVERERIAAEDVRKREESERAAAEKRLEPVN